jgi:F-type H+-transporting ATPase subunit delta
MRTAKQTKREAKHLFRFCLVNDLLDEGRTRRIVQRIIERKGRSYLALLSEFRHLVRLDREARTAEVETAAPLPPDLRATIKSRLEHAYGLGINVRFAQKPALIGGMRIKVGSDVFDGSVQSELAALGKIFGINASRGRNAETAPQSRSEG